MKINDRTQEMEKESVLRPYLISKCNEMKKVINANLIPFVDQFIANNGLKYIKIDDKHEAWIKFLLYAGRYGSLDKVF